MTLAGVPRTAALPPSDDFERFSDPPTSVLADWARANLEYLSTQGELIMANETILTVIGNLTSDPELRFTPNGAAVANFTVASTRASSIDSPMIQGRGNPVPPVLGMEGARRELRRVPAARHPRRSSRAASSPDRLRRRRARSAPLGLDVDEIGPSLRGATARRHEDAGWRRWVQWPAEPAAGR